MRPFQEIKEAQARLEAWDRENVLVIVALLVVGLSAVAALLWWL
jgi:hypothetical protein